MTINHFPKISNGEELVQLIEDQVRDIIAKEELPEIIVVGSFFYFLLKQYHNTNIDTKRNKYFDIYSFPIFGFDLEVHIKRETMKEGRTHKDGNFLKVYVK